MEIQFLPEKRSIQDALSYGRILLACVFFDGTSAYIGLREEYPEYADLLKAAYRIRHIDRSFHLVLTENDCNWKFRTPENYRGIYGRTEQILQYHRDGIQKIQTFLHLLEADIPIRIPKRHERELEWAQYRSAPYPPELVMHLESGQPFAVFWHFQESPSRLPDYDDALLQELYSMRFGGCREDGYYFADYHLFTVHYAAVRFFRKHFASVMKILAAKHHADYLLLYENGTTKLYDMCDDMTVMQETTEFRMQAAEELIRESAFGKKTQLNDRILQRRTAWHGTDAFPTELRAAEYRIRKLLEQEITP